MAADPSTRPRFVLPSASALRDRADRVGEQLRRRGRPRRRFLAEQRERLAVRMLPTLGLAAAVLGIVTASDMFFRTPAVSRLCTFAEVAIAIVLGGMALAVPILKHSLVGLRSLAFGAVVATTLGLAVVVRETGGASSEYLLAGPLGLAIYLAVMPLPPMLATVAGAAGAAALLVAAPRAPISAHVLALAVMVGGATLARRRHRAALSTFLRVERLSAKVAQLRRMQEQLVVVEKLEALRVLVGGMAHELNNALTVAVASADHAKQVATVDPAQTVSLLTRTEGGLRRIRRTVDRLRRFAMAAEGRLEAADVGAMLDFALESAIGRARSGVIVDRVYDPEVGAIECHVSALAEALYQIARNAVEAMPGGGTIQASVRREGQRVVLTVADEGSGIPPEQLAKVFDPFYTGRPNAAKSGLGLSAVYGLVNALGGQVRIKSDVGRGTEVSIEMPAKRAVSTPPSDPRQRASS